MKGKAITVEKSRENILFSLVGHCHSLGLQFIYFMIIDVL